MRVAGAGPMPISVGSTPTSAQCVEPRERREPVVLRRAFADASSSAAPPSTMPLALPAVTQPFLLNAAGSFASPSIVVSGRMWSSCANELDALARS